MHARTHTHMHTHARTHTHTHTQVHTHRRTHTHTQTYTPTHTHTRSHARTSTHTHTYTQTHTHTHTHAHTHTYTRRKCACVTGVFEKASAGVQFVIPFAFGKYSLPWARKTVLVECHFIPTSNYENWRKIKVLNAFPSHECSLLLIMALTAPAFGLLTGFAERIGLAKELNAPPCVFVYFWLALVSACSYVAIFSNVYI